MKQLFSKGNRVDLFIGLVVIICLLLSSTLFTKIMPSNLVMLAVGVFIAAFSLFSVLIWQENPRDEREAHITLTSDRLGFLAGAIVLSLGLVYEALKHQSTTTMALALSAMVLAKLIGKYLHK